MLNSCYSEVQGEVIRQEIDNVVGMCTAVDDDAARRFAVAFYDGVFAGTDFRIAFDLACTALDLNNIPDLTAPSFLTSPHLDANSISYTANIPEAERVLYAYLNTPYSDRWIFTTTGESLSPALTKYYGERIQRSVDKVRVLGMHRVGEDHWRSDARIFSGDDKWVMKYYFRKRERAIYIEWGSSTFVVGKRCFQRSGRKFASSGWVGWIAAAALGTASESADCPAS